ncbi:MAG: hypothetical protein WCI36_00355 [bacterium]
MKKQTNKKIVKKTQNKPKRKQAKFLTLGNVNPQHGRILGLMLFIIFVTTVMTMIKAFEKVIVAPEITQPIRINKPTALATEIEKMVEGYPIEQMTPYIVKQDPKTAMFLVAIAKKESAWGKRKPVLDGNDCYNYWGFRLKADKMGSGGHTCFDSPEQAVDTIAQRIDELVKNENIDTPKEMVIWKCGYACQNRDKNASEEKWIKDVSIYYDKLLN